MPRLFGLLLSAFLLFPQAGYAADAAADETTPSRATVENWVRDYLVNNPEVIVEALDVLQKRQAALEERQQRDLIAAMSLQFADHPLTYVAGKPDFSQKPIHNTSFLTKWCTDHMRPPQILIH